MHLTILSEPIIAHLYEPTPPEILISIRDPFQGDLIPFGSFTHIYHLKMYDLAETVHHPHKGIMPCMSLEQAVHLLAFVCQHLQDAKRWTVHCGAGISRSPAVAMALADLFEGAPSSSAIRQQEPYFNPHVYTCLLNAARNCPSYSAKLDNSSLPVLPALEEIRFKAGSP